MTDKSILAATPFAGEAFLVSWSESSKGRKVTFELPADTDIHPFKEFRHGTRFMLACTKIGDDEQPARVKSPAVIGAQAEPAQQKKHFRDMPRSQQAALKLSDYDFCDWYCGFKVQSLDLAEKEFKKRFGILSKRELDTVPSKAELWDATLTDYDTRGYTR